MASEVLIGEDVSNKQIVLCDDAIISTYAVHRDVPISLKKNLPESKIFLTIRSQKTAVESNYLAQAYTIDYWLQSVG